MKNIAPLSPLLIIIFTLLFIAPASYGASVKDRMAARIPEISSLKDKGVVGENNKGRLTDKINSARFPTASFQYIYRLFIAQVSSYACLKF